MITVDNVFDNDTITTGGSGPDFGLQGSELGFTAGLGVTHFFGVLPNPRVIGVRANATAIPVIKSTERVL